MSRRFRKIAFLLRPENLKWPEAAETYKELGFTDLAFQVQETFSSSGRETEFSLDDIQEVASGIRHRGLGIILFTGYIKTMAERLSKHPDQRAYVVSLPGAGPAHPAWSSGARPEEGPQPHSTWACPYNPEYKAYYYSVLRRMGAIPGVVDVWLDDEARLGQATGIGCYCARCQADFGREFGAKMPLPHEHEHPLWKDFLAWRFRRWTEIHDEMRQIIHEINPSILCGCQVNAMIDLMGQNAWLSAVDLCDLADHQDMLTVNPYHTAHCFMWKNWGSAHAFNEQLFKPEFAFFVVWSQWLRACVPAEKEVTVIPQGFNPPTYGRAYTAGDGAWMSLVPMAIGVDNNGPWVWETFATTPAALAFLKGLSLSPYFEEMQPLYYAAVVHSFQTEVYAMPSPHVGRGAFDVYYFHPVLEALQHYGLSNTPWPDQRLDDPRLETCRVLLLPEVQCLSERQKESLVLAMQTGKALCGFGHVGMLDERGEPGDSRILEDLFGISLVRAAKARQVGEGIDYLQRGFELAQGLTGPGADLQPIVPLTEHPVFDRLESGYPDSPLLLRGEPTLRRPLEARALPGTQVIAVFADEEGKQTDVPAIVIKEHPNGARCVWFAGVPDRPGLGRPRNSARVMAVRAAEWAGRTPCPVRLHSYPPVTEYLKIRPNDSRTFPTWGFYPSVGEGGCLVVVTAYFPEVVSFDLVAEVEEGKEVTGVTDLWSGAPMDCRVARQTVTVPLSFGLQDYVKVVHVQWAE